MKMDYQKSVELALAKGYEEVPDSNAYKGHYYVKEGLIWIHDIDALKSSLGVNSINQLRELNYDVDAYEKYKDYSNDMASKEMQQLYVDLDTGDGQPVYLMDGMYLFPDGRIEEL